MEEDDDNTRLRHAKWYHLCFLSIEDHTKVLFCRVLPRERGRNLQETIKLLKSTLDCKKRTPGSSQPSATPLIADVAQHGPQVLLPPSAEEGRERTTPPVVLLAAKMIIKHEHKRGPAVAKH